MKDNIIAYNYLKGRGVTRLCHFTKVRSLVQILSTEDGILATDFIDPSIKEQNDKNRFDNAPDYVCCSLQYPNGWYWNSVKSRDTDKIFREWVVLTIDLSVLKYTDFRFCHCNAGTQFGAYIRDDVANISEIFNNSARYRPLLMLDCCPTDDQAEILVYKSIPLQYATGIIVGSNSCANNVGAILKTFEKSIPVFVSQDICNTNWSKMVRNGQEPQETEYDY